MQMDIKNKQLKEAQSLNQKYLVQLQQNEKQECDNDEMDMLKQENMKLKYDILSYKQCMEKSMIVNEEIIDKLDQNHRIIRYLQQFSSNFTSSSPEYLGGIGDNEKNDEKIPFFVRLIFIIVLTVLLSVSWSGESNNMNKDMDDMSIVLKQVSFEIYDRFMFSELMYFVQTVLFSII